MTDMLNAALGYVALGWPVFPLHTPQVVADRPQPIVRCSCGAPDCGKQTGKHPRTPNGFYSATLDIEQVRRWWTRWPDANIGVRTGVACDLFDIDAVDPLEATAHLEMFEIIAPTARSGSGGWHFYVAPTGFGNRESMGGHPLDWRGVGGYAVVPPSLHRSGNRYEWVTPPDAVEPRQCPEVLRSLVAGDATPSTAETQQLGTRAIDPFNPRKGRRRRVFSLDDVGWNVDGLVAAVETAPKGKRNAMLHWAACRVGEAESAGKCTPAEARSALNRLGNAATESGLTTSEVHGKTGHKGTLLSGYRNGVTGKGGAA